MHSKIVLKVFKTLSPSDRICFALSCKFTFAYLLACLWFWFFGQTIPGKPKRTVFGAKLTPWARIRLLRRLQNSRFQFCAQYWTLHPRSIWNIQPFWRLDHKVCSYGCHTLGSRKCYLPYAGDVYMCPCIHLNIHHKLQLISLCHQQPLDSKGGIQHLSSCKCIGTLLHTCTFNRHPSAQVRTNVSISFGCHDRSLHIRTRLLFDFKKATPSQLEKFWNTRGICVRENTGKWVDRFFQEARGFFGGGMDRKPCQWFSWDVNDEGPLEITLNRNLGKREWPSKSWIRNSRKSPK
jgi:hypothetical protein